MNNKRMPPKKSDTPATPLQGEEAVQLYTAEIARNIAALGEQAGLLKAQIAGSKKLLDEIDRGQAD